MCAALGITGALNGVDLAGPRLSISEYREDDVDIRATTRIGLTRAADLPWRFFVASSPYVSGPRRVVFGERP